MKSVRVGFIGCGNLATQMHYPSLAAFDDVEIAAICDLNQERLNKVGDTYSVEKRYTDYQQMVEEVAPDAVYAVGPPQQMYPVWVWCLSHKLHLFLEKPPGLYLHQARTLADLAQKNGCVTAVGFQRRYSPVYAKMKEECEKEGPVIFSVSTVYKYSWRVNTGAMDHLAGDGVHAIDTLRWACGGEVRKISCMAKSFGEPDLNVHTATIEFDSGAIGVLLDNFASGRRIFRLEMHSQGVCAEGDLEDKGYVYVRQRGWKPWQLEPDVYSAVELAGSDDFRVYGGYEAINRVFIDGVKNGTQPAVNVADALKTMEIVEHIRCSAMK
jgi:virulence factor